MRFAREGFDARSQRRGVMPLVTLVNLSMPKTLTKSLKMVALMRSECNSATPLTFLEPMMARKAIRTDWGLDSSIMDTLASNSRSCNQLDSFPIESGVQRERTLGNFFSTVWRKKRLMS